MAKAKSGGKLSAFENALQNVKSDDPKIRKKACGTLWRAELTAEKKQAAKAVLPLLHDPDPRVVREALGLLGYLEVCRKEDFSLIAELATNLKTPKAMRRKAISYLGVFGVKAIAPLVELFDAFPSEVTGALYSLGNKAQKHAAKFTPLISQINDPEKGRSAASLFGDLKLDSSEIRSAQKSAARNQEFELAHRCTAAEALLRTEGEPALEIAYDVVRSGPSDYPAFLRIMQSHVKLAGKIAGFREAGWPWIKKLLESDHWENQCAALHAFGDWRQPNEEAITMIFASVDSPNEEVAKEASKTVDLLNLVRKDRGLDQVLERLKADSYDVRVKAVRMLGKFDLEEADPEGEIAIPALVAALDDSDFRVREAALKELILWEKKATPAIKKCLDMLGDATGWLEEAEQLAGPGVRHMLKQLIENPNIKSLDSDKPITNQSLTSWLVNYYPRPLAADVLLAIGPPEADEALPLAQKCLDEEKPDLLLRPKLDEILAKFDPTNPKVLADIQRLLKSRKKADVEDGMDLVKNLPSLPAEIVIIFQKLLGAKSRYRKAALGVTRSLEKIARPLMEEVADALSDPNEDVRRRALWSLEGIEPEDWTPLADRLLPIIADEEMEQRLQLGDIVIKFGDVFNGKGVKPLEKIVRTKKASNVEKALASAMLLRIGEPAEPLLEPLKAGLTLELDDTSLDYFEKSNRTNTIHVTLQAIASRSEEDDALASLADEVEQYAEHDYPYIREPAQKAMEDFRAKKK
jgi:HEAT repeat protein